MGTPVKILVVEDEMIIGAKISLLLSNLGYEVTAIIPRGEEALQHIREQNVDIILLDIQLKGNMDGIETATRIQSISQIPVIYLTANSDEATFNRAKLTKPAAFISKPFKQLDLQRAIELAIIRMTNDNASAKEEILLHDQQPLILSDRIFVRYREKMMKIMIADILYIEADRNYSRIFTQSKEILLTTTLKVIEEKLSNQPFIRIHRSYLVNLSHIDEVGDGHVVIAGKAIPLSAALKEQLLERIQTL